jgi:hypothetical protein
MMQGGIVQTLAGRSGLEMEGAQGLPPAMERDQKDK